MNAVGWLAVAATGALGLLSDRRFQRLPQVPLTPVQGRLPMLSIIIPARNEGANLPRLLPSLQAHAYPGPLEVIVVDDGSTDATGAIAERLGARLLRVSGPAPGWLGKPHACHIGAAAATGEWLLFTDADTVHSEGGPASAVAWAAANRLDGLSLFPGHERGVPAESIVLALAFAGYFAGQARANALLNGQYILLKRSVYRSTGGFAAVRSEPMEDLALGRRLHELGHRVAVARGEALVRVRMYDTLSQMWHGFTRLAALSLRWTGSGALLTAGFTTAAAAPVLDLAAAILLRRGRAAALTRWCATCVLLAPWLRRFQVGMTAPAVPLAATFVQCAGIWGWLARLLGQPIHWRGRSV